MAIETIGEDTSATQGTLVTASATAGNFGSYAELTASSGQTCELFTLNVINSTGGATRSSIIEIATGAASSETPLFEVILPGDAATNGKGLHMTIPITIASGTRIAARSRSSVGSTALRVTGTISDEDSFGTGSAAELLTANTTKGTVIDPGGTANTKGSWTQMTASTSHDYDMIFVFVGHNNNNLSSTARWLIDIGTGAASSETVVVPDLLKGIGIFEGPNTIFPIYVNIASGTRVAVRAQCNITDGTDRQIDVGILGVNLAAPGGGGGSATTASGFMV